ncbi:Ig-like domain-containing protein [Bowmanella dokdonensis]|uniref:Ig-like domain-containing protein n=1 Tax=Bowmanella dokdonensis TaxID=751969 RepID=A0A939DRF1_9ALTE|nr:Ig-like domain-containing protein [Bowmanella dokdonensis]MBN7826992.1 Ig-like domain-containing protein [Bowmanella dokdonensis]
MTSTLKAAAICLLSMSLIACGGGGSLGTDGGNGGGSTAPVTIDFRVVDASGTAVDPTSSQLTSANPWTIQATVSQDGSALSGQLVTFTMPVGGYATFNPASGTATTDSQGIASMGLRAGDVAGGFSVVARTGESNDFTLNLTSAGDGSAGEDQPASLQAFAENLQLGSSGSGQTVIIASVKNDNNNAMEGVAVQFSSDSGLLEVTEPVTLADGTARAILTTPNDPENRDITVTAASGNLSSSVIVKVVGTEISISGTRSVTVNSASTLTVALTNSEGNPIANRQVTLTAGDNSRLSATGGSRGENNALLVMTNVNGVATVTYESDSAGSDTIQASALNSSDSFDITIQQDDFTFSSVPSDDVALNETASLTVTWLQNGSPLVGGLVSLTTSRGVITSANPVATNASGQVSFTLESNNAGIASLTASGDDGSGSEVTVTTEVAFVATQSSTLVADASPDIIGADGDTSTITAVVRDNSGNLVKGAVVNFNVSDVSTGSISPNQATTNSKGVATTIFTSGSVTSQEAVVISAVVSGTPSANDTVTLTVGGQAFDVSLGTGSLIQKPDDVTYLKEFAVFVSDTVGSPVPNVDLTLSATPVKFNQGGVYRKGFWIWNAALEVWETQVTAVCPNEDINGNGFLDAGEDNNGDGQLTPGIVGTISFSDGDSTDENGQANLDYRYPREYGAWYDAEIGVFAQSAGSEAKESMKYTLGVAADDLSNEASPPPNSPYGLNADCSSTD